MQMIGARENGTRHRETGDSFLSRRTIRYAKHDDGNDAWRGCWAWTKISPILRSARMHVTRYRWGPTITGPWRYLVGRPMFQILDTYRQDAAGWLLYATDQACFVRNLTYVVQLSRYVPRWPRVVLSDSAIALVAARTLG